MSINTQLTQSSDGMQKHWESAEVQQSSIYQSINQLFIEKNR